MKNEDILYSKYKKAVASPGGEVFLYFSEATRFARDLKNENIAIIGIEGFYYRDGKIEPQMDMITDFSPRVEKEDAKRNWATFRASRMAGADYFFQYIVDNHPLRDLIFCFVLCDEDDFFSWRKSSIGFLGSFLQSVRERLK